MIRIVECITNSLINESVDCDFIKSSTLVFDCGGAIGLVTAVVVVVVVVATGTVDVVGADVVVATGVVFGAVAELTFDTGAAVVVDAAETDGSTFAFLSTSD